MASGGSIDVKSEEGKGTDFIISLSTKIRLDEAKYNRALENSMNISSLDTESEANYEFEH
jgi:hypothetical protein